MTYDNSYTCNPSYIVDEIVRRNLPVDIVFVAPGDGSQPRGIDRIPPSVRLVRRGTAKMFREQATSRIWIDNALNCLWYQMPKKKNQVYINTWHGSLGIKKLSGDQHWLQIAKRCRTTTDYCITNSQFEEDVFRHTFWPHTPFLRYGHARNDILLNHEAAADVSAKVRSYFGIDADKKILLYAPTFRDNGNTRFLNVDYQRVREALEERFSGEWVILARLHFKNRKDVRFHAHDCLVDATDYPEMQELMVAADAGITDYSSWAYDFVLTGKPLFLYTPDIDDYNQDRGFYYNLDTTPFPLSRTNDGLASSILAFDDAAYQRDVQRFLKGKGCYESGHAARLAVDKIQKLLGL